MSNRQSKFIETLAREKGLTIVGPDALTIPEKASLLRDPMALSQLHFQVWTSPDAHQSWLQTHQLRQDESEAPTGQYGGYGGPPFVGQLPHQA